MKYATRGLLVSTLWLLVATPSQAQVIRAFAEPIERREVAATQPDVVAIVRVREGAKVKAGEILAELDNNVLKQSLKIAELRADSTSSIRSADASHRLAKRKYEKLVPMLEKGHANPAEVEAAQAEYEQSASELQLALEKQEEFRYEAARIQAEIERRIIRSPIDGVVTEIYCQPGEYIASQERQLATVVCLEQLKVRYYLLEDAIQNIQVGQTLRLGFGDGNKTVQGVVDYVSPVTDPDSATARVDVIIDNADRKLRSGTPVRWQGVPSLIKNQAAKGSHDLTLADPKGVE